MSVMSLALVSLTIFSPFVSATYACDKVSPIDTSCALHIAQTSITNLNFADPKWNKDDWDAYIIQDGKYLLHYKEMVTDQIEKLCKDQEGSSQFKDIVAKLNQYPFNLDDYEKNYEVDVKGAKDTVLLQDYMKHYQAQTDCYDLLSASLPCLCIYPAVAKVVKFNNDGKGFPGSTALWVKDNASSGATCGMVQEAVGNNLKYSVYDQSMKFELEFFKLTKNSELALNSPAPKGGHPPAEDL